VSLSGPERLAPTAEPVPKKQPDAPLLSSCSLFSLPGSPRHRSSLVPQPTAWPRYLRPLRLARLAAGRSPAGEAFRVWAALTLFCLLLTLAARTDATAARGLAQIRIPGIVGARSGYPFATAPRACVLLAPQAARPYPAGPCRGMATRRRGEPARPGPCGPTGTAGRVSHPA
jgi:hypothetical protein